MKQTLFKLSTIMMLTFGTFVGADMPGAAGRDDNNETSHVRIDTYYISLTDDKDPEISAASVFLFPCDPNTKNEKLGDVLANLPFSNLLKGQAVYRIYPTMVRESDGRYAPITDEQIEILWATILAHHPKANRAAGLASLPFNIAATFLGDTSGSEATLPTAPYILRVEVVDPDKFQAREVAKLFSCGPGEEEDSLAAMIYEKSLKASRAASGKVDPTDVD
jgi:hypothetical protein